MGEPRERIDGWRNALALLATYLWIAAVVLAALWFFRWREGRVHWWTDIPVGLFAVALIGPAQHRLLILGQEAAMGLLFRNRWVNELVGDWLIHFPFSSATHHVRQQIRSHYEFPNDPAKDAELVISRRAGFWPLRLRMFLRLSAFIKWNAERANYNFRANPENPFDDPAHPPSKVALNIGTAYVLLAFAVLLSLFFFRADLGDDAVEWVLTFGLPGLGVAMLVVFAVLPARFYHQGLLPGVYSARMMTLMRVTFISLVNLGLGWTTFLTERSAVLNYVALWIGPMFTVTPTLYLLRQWRQHGDLPEGQVAWDRRPGLLGRIVLFPLNQHLHAGKHSSPRTPWARLADVPAASPTSSTKT